MEAVTTVWVVAGHDIPFWLGMVGLVLFYGALTVLAALFRRSVRRRRRDRYADLPPVTVIPLQRERPQHSQPRRR